MIPIISLIFITLIVATIVATLNSKRLPSSNVEWTTQCHH